MATTNGVSYSYDANGNMIGRVENGVNYAQGLDNRVIDVSKSGAGVATFAHDAAGIRVKTVHPGGKTSYFPFPGYEEEVNGSTTTRRITYAIAGQTVALRVQVVGTGGSNILYYLHSDHLGSTSLATTTTGALVGNTTARYLPFGGFRTTPTAGLTDIGFTGHRHNNLPGSDLGLVYMNARFFVPSIGRFASADTIVPDPTNPQSWNRYSYVNNQPLVYNDPTGHWLESAWDALNVGMGIASFVDNVKQGNYGWAAVDALGVVVDTAALVAPIVPGGVSAIIKGTRVADTAVDAIQTVNQVSNAAQTANQAANVVQGAQTAARNADEALQASTTTIRNVSGSNPISMDEALERASSFMESGVPIRSAESPSGVQFIQEMTDTAGNQVTRRAGFDINPYSKHVENMGPHLNLQTRINGRPVLVDPHTPIDPSTIRRGDY